MKDVDIDPGVVAEFMEAVRWYEEKQEGVGRRFAQDLDNLFESLPSYRMRPLRGFKRYGASFVEVGKPWPYRLIVIERGTSLWVVALAHNRRQPGYWLPRVTG